MITYDNPLPMDSREEIVNWIRDKVKAPLCPLCHCHKWELGPHILEVSTSISDGMVDEGMYYPFVVTICDNCCYTRHFFLGNMGIMGSKKVLFNKDDGDNDNDAS